MFRAVLAVCLALSTSAFAQTAMGSLAGVVVDAATHDPLAEAHVTARGPALIGEQSAITDATGAFEMTFLPPGSYTLSVKREGYQPFTPETLTLKAKKAHVRIAIVAVPSAPPAPVETAVEFNDAMTPPAMLAGPAPEYTTEAIERGVEGMMQVRCIVAVDGQVRGCKVVKGLPFMNAAVVEALQKRKYRPALAQGKPVDVYFTFNIRLKLPQ